MENIYFRVAVLEDLPTLYDFEQGIITWERPFDETLKPDPITYYDIRALIEAANSEVIVALINDKIVASAYIQIKEALPYLKHDYFGYLGFMYVAPEYRGKGINQKIMEELKTWARKKDIYELRLSVYYDNHSAVKAYKKVGFEKQLVSMRMEI